MSGWLRIVEDDLADPRVVALLEEHLAGMRATSPPESVHALDVDGLRRPGVTFWTAWDDEAAAGSVDGTGASALAGCRALQELAPDHGEVKSMRTARTHLRRGVAAALLEHLLAEAAARGWSRVSLETGSGPDFAAAHALYVRHGFVPCGPYAAYVDDPFSRFLTRAT